MTKKEKLKLTIEIERASRGTQVLLQRSDLPRSEQVQAAEAALAADPANAALWMEKGLALAKQMLCREATEAFSVGLSLDPFNWLLLRHRGHRHLSTYRFAEAAADLELASRINDHDWDIWYHLGLSYYLLGDFARANQAYDRCLAITNHEDINLVAIVDWKWLTLMRLGRKTEAQAILNLVDEQTEAGENQAYKDLLMLYKCLITPEQALEFENPEFADLELATRGYGVAMYYYYHGKKQQAAQLLQRILERDVFWSAFGYLAAYQETNEGRLEL